MNYRKYAFVYVCVYDACARACTYYILVRSTIDRVLGNGPRQCRRAKGNGPHPTGLPRRRPGRTYVMFPIDIYIYIYIYITRWEGWSPSADHHPRSQTDRRLAHAPAHAGKREKPLAPVSPGFADVDSSTVGGEPLANRL